MEAVGYEDFRDDNPKQNINLLLQRVEPVVLRNKMFQRLKYDRSLEKDVPRLIGMLKTEAIARKEYGDQVSRNRTAEIAPSNDNRRQGRSGGRSKGRGSTKSPTSDDNAGSFTPWRSKEGEKGDKEPPLCLYEH